MPLIDGIGDEVLQFMVMTCLIAMMLVAWMSTNARPNRYRTLLVMRSHNPHPVTVSIRSRAHADGNASRVPNILYTNTSARDRGSPDTVTLSTTPATDSLLESGPIIPLQEMDSIVDADMALFENNRLHFYRRVEQSGGSQDPQESPPTSSEREVAGNDQIREMDSIVSAMEADITTDTRPTESNPAPIIERVNQGKESTHGAGESTENTPTVDDADHQPDNGESKKILIRLKYLNDTLKEVEGSLDEPLKDFKWRHFSRELSGSWRVRLIHRGRLLADEGASLRALGLSHRDVVHALLHPPRANQLPPEPPANSAGAGAGTNQAPSAPRPAERPGGAGGGTERGWDLENILMTLVSVALTIVWFFRCEYSNMFTASASVALFGLTVFYSVAIFGLYLSDTFNFDRRDRREPIPVIPGGVHALPNPTANN